MSKVHFFATLRLRKCPHDLRAENGGAIIETALVMPVLCAIVFGILQFGILLFAFCSAAYASRVGVRYASLHSSSSLAPATAASVKNIVTPYLWMGNQSSITVSPTWTSMAIGGTATVTVQITFNVGLPFTSTRQISISSAAARLITR